MQEEVKTYLESGILELYAMGELSATEKQEVEAMAAKHPEIKEELLQIERALEQYSDGYAINPPAAMRDKVLGSLDINEQNDTPITQIQPWVVYSGFYKYAFAASVALLMVSLVALFSVYSQLQDSKTRLAELNQAGQTYANRVNLMDKEMKEQQDILNIYRDPESKVVKLDPMEKAPAGSKIMVIFNPASKDVMIDAAMSNMPANDADHQYQLWAMVDNKPVDLGVFDMTANADSMMRMKSVENAQAFAVTVEPRGGSVVPTLSQLMVMGKVSI